MLDPPATAAELHSFLERARTSLAARVLEGVHTRFQHASEVVSGWISLVNMGGSHEAAIDIDGARNGWSRSRLCTESRDCNWCRECATRSSLSLTKRRIATSRSPVTGKMNTTPSGTTNRSVTSPPGNGSTSIPATCRAGGLKAPSSSSGKGGRLQRRYRRSTRS
jgi:hypothetical protein